MANLPEDRVESTLPFTYRGLDCFVRPCRVKERRKELKRYAMIFTCTSSPAVHLEQLNDMTTDTFTNALRCFTAIRGPIQQIRRDQGSNFAEARNELVRVMKELDNDKIQSYFDNQSLRIPYEYPLFQSLSRSMENSVLKDYKGRLDTSSVTVHLLV